MTNTEKLRLLQSTILGGFLAGMTATTAIAQDTAPPAEPEAAEELVEELIEDQTGGDIVVTGSRIKRDTFSSLAPLQVIDFDESRDLGILTCELGS